MISNFSGLMVMICAASLTLNAHANENEQNFSTLAQNCASEIHQDTLRRIVNVESSFNPFAIGVVGGRLERQPKNREEAIVTAQWLENNGFNYSVGLAQVNKKNFRQYGLTLQTAFETCPNLHAGGEILKDCFSRAKKNNRSEQEALRDAFSCYYSGNFITGYKLGYVQKIVGTTTTTEKVTPIKVVSNKKKIAYKKKLPAKTTASVTAEATNTPQSALLF